MQAALQQSFKRSCLNFKIESYLWFFFFIYFLISEKSLFLLI